MDGCFRWEGGDFSPWLTDDIIRLSPAGVVVNAVGKKGRPLMYVLAAVIYLNGFAVIQ